LPVSKTLIVILGPTAVGKTAFAIDLAKHYRTDILSADSRQFYKELNIGVARPSESELAQAHHHFIGFLSIQEHYSAGMYERDALLLLEKLFREKDVVICVGGSMLYIDALIVGLDTLPSDKALKQQLTAELQEKGIEHLQQKLQSVDPEYYAEVDIHNPHRIVRALEVIELTGEKYSVQRKGQHIHRPFNVVKIGLTAQRNNLYKRINQRVDKMMSEGLLHEVQKIAEHKELNALNTVGYKELFDYLEGKSTLEFAVEKIKQHSRNFAKRQLTWWRRDKDIFWMDVTTQSPTTAFVEKLISQSKNQQ
jgi:tRNA dimethylallyltransferase